MQDLQNQIPGLLTEAGSVCDEQWSWRCVGVGRALLFVYMHVAAFRSE